MEWRDRIGSDPRVCHGLACISGTRVPVAVVLDSLAEDGDLPTLLRSYPGLAREDVLAAIAYAADLVREHGTPPGSSSPAAAPH